jgi:hypothetical protein
MSAAMIAGFHGAVFSDLIAADTGSGEPGGTVDIPVAVASEFYPLTNRSKSNC